MILTAVENQFLTYGDWSDFKEKFNKIKDNFIKSEEEMCSLMEVDYEFYDRITSLSVYNWKDSPSTSLFNAISSIGLNLPQKDQNIFNNHLDQTRFLTIIAQNHIVGRFQFASVRDENNEKVKVMGDTALTIRKDNIKAQEKINKVLQVLFLYRYYRHQVLINGDKNLPKKLYRGIRISNLYKIPEISKILKENKLTGDFTFYEGKKHNTNLILDYLKDKKFNAIAQSNLVSFTSSKAIAKYFTGGEGFVVEISTKNLPMESIFTSPIQDTRFDEKDWVSNKKEKEFIIDVTLSDIDISDIVMNDLHYLIATNNPLSVSLFDHDNKKATYKLNGVNIKAYYVWTSNTTGGVRYRNLDDEFAWGYGPIEFKKEYGFDPRITEKNVKDVTDFQVIID